MKSQEVVAAKFKEIKEEILRRKDGGYVGGSNIAIQGEILPSWGKVIEGEESHDRNSMFDWDFSQIGVININIIIFQKRRRLGWHN